MKFHELENSTQIILKVVLAGLALAFLWVIRDIILLLLMALIFASAMEPMVDYFSKKRVPRAVSVLTVYLLVIGFAAMVVYLFIPPVVEQLKLVQASLPEYMASLQARFGSTWLSGVDFSNIFQQFISGSGGDSVLNKTFGVFNGLLSIITVLVISFYLVAEEKGMKDFITTLIPDHHQAFTMELMEKIQRKMGLWILGQIILSFFIFVFVWIGLSLLGVRYALFLALLAGLLEVMPYIGPFMSAVPGILFAFIQSPGGGPGLAIAAAVLYLLIQKTEGYVLVPKIMQKTVGTSPLVVLLALLIGFKLAGIVGLLIAVPLASAITVAVHEFWAVKSV